MDDRLSLDSITSMPNPNTQQQFPVKTVSALAMTGPPVESSWGGHVFLEALFDRQNATVTLDDSEWIWDKRIPARLRVTGTLCADPPC